MVLQQAEIAVRIAGERHLKHGAVAVARRGEAYSLGELAVENWQKSGLNLIHTTWGRPNNFWTLYPPWAGLIPVFAAAGGTSNEDDDGYFFSMFEEWQSFSNRLEELKREFHFLSDSRCSRKIVRRKYGCISDFVEIDCEEQCKHLGRRIAEWKIAVSEFFKKHALSDGEEFIESRTAFFSISDK